MKKIILALMMMVSVSFADSWVNTSLVPPLTNGVCYYDSSTSLYYVPFSSAHTGEQDFGSKTSGQFLQRNTSSSTSGSIWNIYTCRIIAGSNYCYSDRSDVYIYTSRSGSSLCSNVNIPICTQYQTLDTATNTCVDKPVDTNNSNCDNITKYADITTGKCVDCMQFSGFTSRASCACDAQGSTYTPGHSTGVVTWSTQSTMSYKKQGAKCDNGQDIYIYYDPIDLSVDTNTSTPSDSNGTKTDTNSTTNTPDVNGSPVTTPTQADIVNALKSIKDGQKDSNTALKELGVDLKAVNTSLKEQGFTFDSILAKIVDGNSKADARYQLMDTEYKANTQYRNMMGKWVDQDLKNATAQLDATVDVKKAVDGTTGAVNGTTGAVNAQGDKLGGKLDDILKAIKDSNGSGTKDGNGTDLSKVEDKLDTLHKDNNSSQAKLDTLHGDANTTNSTLKDIKNLLDFNASKYSINDLMPSGGEGWFTTNRLDLNFNNYGGDCYCQTAEFSVAGHQFIFPPQEALDVIPFSTISNIFMAFIYVLGLKAFIKS